jgi:hypothetical protein
MTSNANPALITLMYLIYAQPGPVRLLHIGGDPIYLISQRPDDSLANHRHSAWIGGCNPWSPPA